jgi:hypothetical protein
MMPPANAPNEPPPAPPSPGQVHEFKLERYKFILAQIDRLNEHENRTLTLYQSLTTAIISSCILLFSGYRAWGMPPAAARVSLHALIGLFGLLTLFVMLSLAATIASWFDYRHEEVHLLDQEVGPGFRQPPRFTNLWRWRETYLLLFILFVFLAVVLFAENLLVPLID